MVTKTIVAKDWGYVKPSFDGNRYSQYSAGDKPSGITFGASASAFQQQNSGISPISVTMATATTGSTIIIPTFVEFSTCNAPTDNKGNTISVLYNNVGYFGGAFPGFGMRLCAKTNAVGGSNHIISSTKSNVGQESSLVALEIKNGVTLISPTPITRQAAGAGVPYVSGSVTTTGPAMLVAIWGGDGPTGSHDANPDASWTRREGLNLPDTNYIQAWTATRFVSGAGTYTCTWTPTGNEGAILAILAVQA